MYGLTENDDHDIDIPILACVQSSGDGVEAFISETMGDSTCDTLVVWEDAAPNTVVAFFDKRHPMCVQARPSPK